MDAVGNGASHLKRFGLVDNTVIALSPCLQGIPVAADDVLEVGKGLAANWSLTSLELTRCHVDEAGASALGEALLVNHTLRYLGLSHNPLGDNGRGFGREPSG
ncbi:ribonuclease inhibitor-like protein [Diplonema papillatum]|nr:ribonuclease inhibitor-like protein [Diplonema papillatum]